MSGSKGIRNMVDQSSNNLHPVSASFSRERFFRGRSVLLIMVSLMGLLLLGGCESDDCLNCVELPPPVVPTGVHSISGDNLVIVQWYDISYHPYDGEYNANVEAYYIYSRYYEPGDENIADREFYFIGEVAWNENYDDVSGLHYFYDYDVTNGEQYEYAVTAVNSSGRESALSFEFIIDAPLPMSISPQELIDVNIDPTRAGFDFSELDYGRTDPTVPGTHADIYVNFQGGIPFVQRVHTGVKLQDFGVFLDDEGYLIFEGVSWAPVDGPNGGYSNTGICELIVGHIYVLEINDPRDGTHYAKFGVTAVRSDSVDIIWAYQTIEDLPELFVPEKPETVEVKPVTISF